MGISTYFKEKTLEFWGFLAGGMGAAERSLGQIDGVGTWNLRGLRGVRLWQAVSTALKKNFARVPPNVVHVSPFPSKSYAKVASRPRFLRWHSFQSRLSSRGIRERAYVESRG